MPSSAPSVAKPAGPRTLMRWLATPEASVVFVILALMVYVAARGHWPNFSSEFNRNSLLRTVSLQSTFAIGELLVILTGGIDLSLGSLVSFSGMLLALMANKMIDGGMGADQATILAILAVLAFSLGLGFLHASLVHYLKLPPFVVTLASMSILRSGSQLLNNAVPITVERLPLVLFLGNKSVYITGTRIGVPTSTILVVLIAVAVTAVLLGTRIGRHVYSVGSNVEAARLSGVNVLHVRLFVYGVCSLLGGLAGVLFAGYSGQGDPLEGTMFELNAISAAVIGGAILTGGRGSVIGTVLGAILLETLLNVINQDLSNPTLWRGVVVGTVLLAAVILNQIRIMVMARGAGRAAHS